METANPVVLWPGYQGYWRLMCCCQEGVKAWVLLHWATLPGTETSFSCCWSHREGFCSLGTGISCRQAMSHAGSQARWALIPGCCCPAPLLDILLTMGMVLLQSTRAPGLSAAQCALLGGSKPPQLGLCHAWGTALAAPGAGQDMMPQQVGARFGVCTRAVNFGYRKGALRAGVLFLPQIFV